MPDQDQQLQQKLVEILKPLRLPPHEQANLIKEVTNLLKNFEIDFKDPNTDKALRVTCGACMMQKSNPEFGFDPSKLFNASKPHEPDDFKSVLKKLFENMFKLTPKGRAKKKDEEEKDKELEAKLDQLSERLSKIFGRDPDRPVANDASALGLIGGCLDVLGAGIRTNYGGVDIRISGSNFVPVQGEPQGDTMGTQNFAYPEGDSFKASLKHTEGVDPTGIKLFNLIDDLAEGMELPSEDKLKKLLHTAPTLERH